MPDSHDSFATPDVPERQKSDGARDLPSPSSRSLERRELLARAALIGAGAVLPALGGCAARDGGQTRSGRGADVLTARASGEDTFELPLSAEPAPGETLSFWLPGARAALLFWHEGELSALEATCTHMSCPVVPVLGEPDLVCPCHGSRFDRSGAVLQGPAVSALTRLEVQKQERRLLLRRA